MLVILALITLDLIVFKYLFNTSYFEWYLKNGALTGAIFTLVTLTWDTNKNTGLISANPRHYAGSIQQLIGAQYYAFGAVGKRDKPKYQDGLEPVFLLDMLALFAFALLIILINVLWLILVAPIHYFFVVLLGGPARFYLSSPVRAVAKFEGTKLKIKEIDRELEMPKDWMDLTISNKSVTLTYGLVTLVLAVTRYFM